MLNRRSILGLLGGAAAMPGAIGAKTAAAALGVSTDVIGPMPVEAANLVAGNSSPVFWGSPVAIAFEARRQAQYEGPQRFAHFKSWGPAFRRAAAARELQAEELFRHRCDRDEAFFNRALEALTNG